MFKPTTNIESLKTCRKCPRFVGLDSRSIVICKRHGMEVAVICQPSHDNKGFKNGEMIVRCNLNEEV